MSQETWSWKQRSLAVAAKSTISLKERLAQTDVWIRRELQPADPRYIDGSQKQSWTQWMSEKVAARRHTYGSGSAGVDEIMLFPGWATRRYDRPGELDGMVLSPSKPVRMFPEATDLCRCIQDGCIRIWLREQSSPTRVHNSPSACILAPRKRSVRELLKSYSGMKLISILQGSPLYPNSKSLTAKRSPFLRLSLCLGPPKTSWRQ